MKKDIHQEYKISNGKTIREHKCITSVMFRLE